MEELERRTQALEMRCYRKLFNVTYKDHVTNEEVRNKTHGAIGKHGVGKKRKLRWYSHISRASGMAKIIQGTVKETRTLRKHFRAIYCNISRL